MPKVIGSVVLPRLQVTADDVASLRATGAALEMEVVAQYEDFITRRRRHVDRTKWKLVKTLSDLRAYQEINASTDALGFMSASPTKDAACEPQASMASESNCPRLLVTGTKPGTLDDAMYGCSFTDTASLRTHEAYQRSFLDDSAVLCTIDGPTPEDPYLFLGLAWHLRSFRMGKDRDCLLLQNTRLTKLSTGERIGISIRHSVKHRDLPELVEFSTVRIDLSAVTIFRQHDVDTMELFAMEFIDEKRRGPDMVLLHESARDLLACTTECDAGLKKKLHWLMRKRHALRTPSVSGSVSSREPERAKRVDCCTLCSKSTSGLFAASGAPCQLCTKYVCSRCMVTHEIVVDATTARTVSRPFGFCIECILHTKTVSTLKVARQELEDRSHSVGGGKPRWLTQSSRSTATSSGECESGSVHESSPVSLY